MAGSSSSTQSSTGTSTSQPVQTPQSQWGLQLSQLLSAIGNNQYNWAMNQFNNGMGVTQGNIQQYMDLAGKGAGLAQNLLSRYENVFEPLMNQYIQQAGDYASENRQRFMAGQAESTVSQADTQARNESERQLQSFGINPNSGRYQDLMLTSRIQDAAARAGAGTQASLNTADRGRQMLQTAAQMGQNVPGMTVNALQSAYTGITGAENAILGMLNTGANLTQSAAPFFNAASGAIKMPSQETQSQNQSKGQSGSVTTNPPQQQQQQRQQPQQQGNNGPKGDQNSGLPNPQGSGAQPKSIQNPFYNQPGAGVIGATGSQGTGDEDQQQGSPYPMTGSPEASPYFDQNGTITPMGNPDLGSTSWDQASQNGNAPNWQLPQNTPDFQQQGAGGQSFNYDPQAGSPVGQSPQGPQPSYDNSSGQNPLWNPNPMGSQPADWGNAPQPQQPTMGDYNNGNVGGNQNDFNPGDYQPQPQQPDQQPSMGDYNNGDFGGGQQDFNSNSDYSGGYARGGVIPTSGGQVPRGASPSQGRQTDDVKARLNAGEFVMPRDVVAHKGTEFFNNLISKSRKLRTGMSGPPTGGKMKPALPSSQPSSFVSRRMGA